MDHFDYVDGALCAESVPIAQLIKEYGSPLYIYSRATLQRHYHTFDQAFGDYPHHIHYAVKANGNLAILNELARLGAGFDIVSGGELKRVIAAGGNPSKTIFSGIGKLSWEINLALEHFIECFNVESMEELVQIAKLAQAKNAVAPISMRINPDVDAKTHPYISTGLKDNKFGVDPQTAIECYQFARTNPHLQIKGIACHIGSQIIETSPLSDAMSLVLTFVKQLSDLGIAIETIDFGGGLGVTYRDEKPPSPEQYWQILHQQLRAHDISLPVTIEPGRAMIANAGILVTRIEYLKKSQENNFCIVDAAMNDLLRPALYSAYHEIIEVEQKPTLSPSSYDVVGPICESADFLGKNRQLRVQTGDLLAVRTAGAYAFSLSSNYNARARVAEIMVDDDQVHLIRQRETIESLYALESVLKT